MLLPEKRVLGLGLILRGVSLVLGMALTDVLCFRGLLSPYSTASFSREAELGLSCPRLCGSEALPCVTDLPS